jgi:hypothetical protein
MTEPISHPVTSSIDLIKLSGFQVHPSDHALRARLETESVVKRSNDAPLIHVGASPRWQVVFYTGRYHHPRPTVDVATI